MSPSRRTPWLLWAVRLGGWLPLVWLVYQYFAGAYFVNPIGLVISRTGRYALTFLFLSLACTPLSFVLGFRRLIRVRRPLGLFALLYAALHFTAFAGWDYRFDLSRLWEAIVFQQFVIVGAAGLVLLIALGVTSIPAIRRRMGAGWRRFQRLVYIAGGLIVVHVMWQAKDPWEAWREVAVLAALLVLRIPWIRDQIVKVRRWLVGAEEGAEREHG